MYTSSTGASCTWTDTGEEFETLRFYFTHAGSPGATAIEFQCDLDLNTWPTWDHVGDVSPFELKSGNLVGGAGCSIAYQECKVGNVYLGRATYERMELEPQTIIPDCTKFYVKNHTEPSVEGAVYPADTIVYCVGMNPRADVVKAIVAAAGNTPVKAVGDCNRAQDVAHAVRAAYVAAWEIG